MCYNEILYNSLFIEWGRGTEEIYSVTISCKEHKQSWDQAKGSHGSSSFRTHRLQSCPLWYFPSAPMSGECLPCGWGWSISLHGEHAFTVLQGGEETQWGCPTSWPGSFIAYCGCRLQWEMASQLSLLPWVFCECLQGRSLQQWVLWVGHVGWGCQTYSIPLAFPVKSTHDAG